MVAVVARHAEKSELFSAGERAHPTNERNKLENSVCLQRHPAHCPPFASEKRHPAARKERIKPPVAPAIETAAAQPIKKCALSGSSSAPGGERARSSWGSESPAEQQKVAPFADCGFSCSSRRALIEVLYILLRIVLAPA